MIARRQSVHFTHKVHTFMMTTKIALLLITLITVTLISCEVNREKRKKHKNTPIPESHWKKEYEDELADAMLSTKKYKNYTRVPQSSRTSDNEAVIEKIIETITSSEKYLKKVDSIDFRLNRLDIEVREKSKSIIKQLAAISKATIENNNCGEKFESILQDFRSDMSHIKYILENPNPSLDTKSKDGEDVHVDSNLDTRLNILESQMASIKSGVDSIVSTISEVQNRQYTRPVPSTRSDVSNAADAMALLNEFRRTIREGKTRKCEYMTGRVDRSERYPTDCHEIQMQGFNISGIYKIRPDDMDPFYVLCDLTTAGGGWTVFQNRFDGSQDFYKGWHDYEYGFGNLAGEFWLGLEKLHYLTNQKLYELRIDLETQKGQEAFAGYSVFTVGPEREGYRISTLGAFYGTAGDSLSYHAGQKFSTLDVDNDEWKDGACATEHGGAWWYKLCDKSNLNGKYTQSAEENRVQSIYWISFKEPDTSLSKTKMMIRPLPASKSIDYSGTHRKLLESPKLRPLPDKLGVAQKRRRLHGKNLKNYNQYRYDIPAQTHEQDFFTNYA